MAENGVIVTDIERRFKDSIEQGPEMRRIFIKPAEAVPYRYLDTLHAAIVAGLRASGVAEGEILGPSAKPWTFAAKGYSRNGGQSFLTGLTISSPDRDLGAKISRIDPQDVSWNSTNGDRVALDGGRVTSFSDPVQPGQTELRVCFASPFALQKRGTSPSKEWIKDLEGIDLSAAFSAGLSRRLGRPVSIEASLSKLDLRADGKRWRGVLLREAPGGRKVWVPGFTVNLTLRGSEADLRSAYFAGLGEKTRYGFGCVAPVK